MNNRIKQIRKILRLSQEEFGRRLGVTGSGISNLESGKRNFTDQMVKAICREFNVNFNWFTTGEGEMFDEPDDEIMKVVDEILLGENEFAKSVFRAFAKMDESDWKSLKKFIDAVKEEKK